MLPAGNGFQPPGKQRSPLSTSSSLLGPLVLLGRGQYPAVVGSLGSWVKSEQETVWLRGFVSFRVSFRCIAQLLSFIHVSGLQRGEDISTSASIQEDDAAALTFLCERT